MRYFKIPANTMSERDFFLMLANVYCTATISVTIKTERKRKKGRKHDQHLRKRINTE